MAVTFRIADSALEGINPVPVTCTVTAPGGIGMERDLLEVGISLQYEEAMPGGNGCSLHLVSAIRRGTIGTYEMLPVT
jgi:hypothetical protein